MSSIAKKPKNEKYLKLIYATVKPVNILRDYSQLSSKFNYESAIKRKLIIRKVLLEDDSSYYYKFKNKIERVSKHSVEVISLYGYD